MVQSVVQAALVGLSRGKASPVSPGYNFCFLVGAGVTGVKSLVGSFGVTGVTSLAAPFEDTGGAMILSIDKIADVAGAVLSYWEDTAHDRRTTSSSIPPPNKCSFVRVLTDWIDFFDICMVCRMFAVGGKRI
jgi:hypothetical protein